MQRKPLRVGVMGTGWVARMRHIPTYQKRKDVVLVALYNPSDELAQKAQQEFGVSSYIKKEEFFAQKLDMVSVCAPPQEHFQLIKSVLEKGIHVLTEKPFTMTTEEGKELERIAKEKNLILYPSHNFLFARAVKEADALIAEEEYGKVMGATALQWSSWKRSLPSWFGQLPGGLFFDEAPHLVYLLDHFLGNISVEDAWQGIQQKEDEKPLQRITARVKGVKGWGDLNMWFGAPLSEWFIVVMCQKGVIIIDIFRDMIIHFPAEGVRSASYLITSLLKGDAQVWKQMGKWIMRRIAGKKNFFGIDGAVDDFIGAVSNAHAPRLVAKDGYNIVGLLHTILNMAEERND